MRTVKSIRDADVLLMYYTVLSFMLISQHYAIMQAYAEALSWLGVLLS